MSVEQGEVLDEQAEPFDRVASFGLGRTGTHEQLGHREVEDRDQHLLLAGVVVVDPGDG
jgi:hypothetical protein